MVGLLFISPWIIGFLIFSLYPMVMPLKYSFTDFHGILASQQTGTQIMQVMFRDERFWNAVKNTIYMVIIAVPLNLIFSLLCAILLNLKGQGAILLPGHLLPAIHRSCHRCHHALDLDPETG